MRVQLSQVFVIIACLTLQSISFVIERTNVVANGRQLRFDEYSIESSDIVAEFSLYEANALNIPHFITKKKIQGHKQWFDDFEYDVVFTQINEKQFDTLMKIYSGWSKVKSSVKYSPMTKSYSLKDFIPPVLQSTIGNVFINGAYDIPLPAMAPIEVGDKILNKKAISVTNCWGTVYETMRQAMGGDSSLSVFYAPMEQAKAVFHDETYSSSIRSLTYDEDLYKDASKRNEKLQPGDVLIIGDKYFQHTAVFIDNDFYYEKAGTGNTSTYRITHINELMKTWPVGLHGWKYRRFIDRKLKPLPHPKELFTINKLLKGTPEAKYVDLIKPEQLRNYLSVELGNNDPKDGSRHTDSYYVLFCSLRLGLASNGRAVLPELAYKEMYWNIAKLNLYSTLCEYTISE
jgi:hypothetical protein